DVHGQTGERVVVADGPAHLFVQAMESEFTTGDLRQRVALFQRVNGRWVLEARFPCFQREFHAIPHFLSAESKPGRTCFPRSQDNAGRHRASRDAGAGRRWQAMVVVPTGMIGRNSACLYPPKGGIILERVKPWRTDFTRS